MSQSFPIHCLNCRILAVSAGVPAGPLISNIKFNNSGLAGPAGFTQWIVFTQRLQSVESVIFSMITAFLEILLQFIGIE